MIAVSSRCPRTAPSVGDVTATIETPTRDQLRTHLVTSRIAGNVATTRQNNLQNFGRMSRREPLYLFGLRPVGRWSYEDVLALMAERCGVIADPAHAYGQDTIDPDRTVERLDAMADRIRLAAQRQERVVLGTAHPIGLQPIHAAVAAGLAAAGCTLLTPAAGWTHPAVPELGEQSGRLDWVDSVGVLRSPAGTLKHSHSPLLMEAVLAALDTPPDLVRRRPRLGRRGRAGRHRRRRVRRLQRPGAVRRRGRGPGDLLRAAGRQRRPAPVRPADRLPARPGRAQLSRSMTAAAAS